MIDLHTHILPGLDDGAQSMDEALAMARVALADGIHTVVATPHVPPESGLDWPQVMSAMDALRQALMEMELPLRVLPGAELMISPELPQVVGRDGVFALNRSRYLLVELPFEQYPLYAEQVLFELQLKGLLPILAHPERNLRIQKDPDVLGRMVQRGILVQLTTTSLAGGFGGKVRQTTEYLLTHKMGHFLASDAHSPEQRPPLLTEALARTTRLLGKEKAETMVYDDAARVVVDQVFPIEEPVLKRESWR